MNEVRVEPKLIKETAATMSTKISEYEKTYKELLLVIETTVGWKGVDATTFVNQVKGFEDDYKNLVSILNAYVSILNFCSNSYVDTQEYLYIMGKRL